MELIAKQGLSEQDLQEIRKLAEACNELEGITLKLNYDMLASRPANETNDFLFYDRGVLVGFLGIYCFRSTEAEISGMVHPEYRRKGIFSKLVNAAKEECARRKVPQLIFICQGDSVSGKAFLESLGSTYSFSEYWMDASFSSSFSGQYKVELRKAAVTDNEILVELNHQGFDMTYEDAWNYVEQTRPSDSKITFVVELEGQPIGKLGVNLSDNGAFIYGFCMLKEFRGRGYGKQALRRSIEELHKSNNIDQFQLEVAVDNAGALSLYESCGFQTKNVNHYYLLNI